MGGDRGVWNPHLPYLLLPLPALFRRGSRLFVLFLLWNVTQHCEIFLLFSRFPPLWESGLPPFLLLPPVLLPPPILPGSRPPCPPPPNYKLKHSHLGFHQPLLTASSLKYIEAMNVSRPSSKDCFVVIWNASKGSVGILLYRLITSVTNLSI